MTLRSVCEIYRLTDSIKHGFGHAIHPLELIAAPDGLDAPRVIIAYDCHPENGRVNLGADIIRQDISCTHANIWVLPGGNRQPVCAGFGAACLVEVFKNGKYERLNQHLSHIAADVFGPLHGKSTLEILTNSALIQRLRRRVEGVVMREESRHLDACQSLIISESQAKDLITFIEEKEKNPGMYALWGNNCRNFYSDALRTAGITPPPCSDNRFSHPALEMKMLAYKAGSEIARLGEWILQPPQITARMAMAVREKNSPFILSA